MLAQSAAVAQGCDDALLVSPDGIVLEAPTANVWFREGGRLCTPSLDLPILAGVTRAVLAAGEPGEEGVLELERRLAADEVFITTTLRGVMPVVSVGEARFERGPAAARLQEALRRYAGEP
jgi:branched-subunit amino acid aminotransferase/4-amino-4-deoxychorismate lyase